MAKRNINRTTLKIEAPKNSGEVGHYRVQLVISPTSRAVTSCHFDLLNQQGGGLALQSLRSKDTQWDLARDVADVFMKSAAWELLREREPDRQYVIDQHGQEIKRGRNKGA